MLTKLGKYKLKGELGQGAMGVVYLAEDGHLGRPAALKVMSPSLASDPELLKRFYREAVSAGKLSHPNIVTIYDIDEADGVPYIAMEFLEGQTLQEVIQAGSSISMIRKLDIVAQAAKALNFAHQNGVTHRDVKPSNILILRDGHVKIVDFGIARVEGVPLTRPGIVLGTPYYMSPEQVRGEAVDGRSDIFSLGVILYEMFALKNPFAGRDVPSSLNRICHHTPQPLPELIPDCPPELQKIVQKATAKNREERYQSAEDMFLDTLHLAGTLKRNMVDQHLEQGQRLLREGNLSLAEDFLRKALAVDSSHNLARSLLREVQEQVKARQRQEQVRELLRRTEEAALARRDQECLDLASEVLALEPENEKAQRYRKEAAAGLEKARWAAERVATLRAHVLQAVEKQDFEKAFGDAAQALLEFPGDGGLQELRRRAELQLEARRQELYVEERVRAAQELISAERWTDALASLDEALGSATGSDRLLALRRSALEGQAKTRSEAARREAIVEAQALIEQRKFMAAREQLERTVASVGQSSEVTALLAFAVEQQRKEQRVQGTIIQAESRLREEKYAEAVRVLEKGREECPSPDIDALLASAREQQAQFDQRKYDTLRIARELLDACEASQAVDMLKAAPAALSADEDFQNLLAQASAAAERATMVFRSQTAEGTPAGEADASPVLLALPLSELEVLRTPGAPGPPLDHVLDTVAPDLERAPQVDAPARRRLGLMAAAALVIVIAVAAWLLLRRKAIPPKAAQPPVAVSTPVPASAPPPSAPAAVSDAVAAQPPRRPAKKAAPPPAASAAVPAKKAAPPPAALATLPAGNAAIPSKFGQLTITSDVDGARIALDNDSDSGWTTPHTFPNLKPGRHHVALFMPGYRGTYAEVTVEAGTAKIFPLPMQKPMGAVVITTEPPGLQVLIDGERCGLSPVQKNLTAGHHTVTIEFPTGPNSWGLDVKEGSLVGQRYSMKGQVVAPGTGSIAVQSNPPGATVFVDKKPRAKTNVTLNLSPGHHDLMLSLPSCVPYSQSVEITAGGTAPPIDAQLHCN